EPNARLIGVPNEVRAELETRRASLRIEGRVERQNDDGSIRVRTPRGDIDVQLREGQQPPPRGTPVEVEIPPSRSPERPPEAATIRELPPEVSPQRPAATPVNIEVRPAETTLPSPQTQARPADAPRNVDAPQPLPPEGSVVRLQPLPARVAQNLPVPTPEILPQVVSNISAPIVFEAQVIAQQAISDVQQAAVQIRTPPQTPQPQVQVQGFQPEISQPQIFQTQSFPLNDAAPAQVSQALTPTNTALTPLINAESFTPNIRPQTPPQAQAIQTAITNTPALTVAAQTQISPSLTPNPVIIKPEAINAVIENISPPRVAITPSGITPEVTPNLKPENIITQNQPAGTVSGIVTNITNQALPVLTVYFPQFGAEQIFTLQFPTENITLGTQITFTPQTISSAQTLASPTTAQSIPLPAYLAPQPWPALDDILQTLARAAMPTAQAMVNVTPSPANPAQMGPAMMFFVAAVRGGDLSQWLGQKANDILKLEKGGRALNRLMGEAPTLARAAAEPMGQEWRAMNLPLFWEGDMSKIALYYKHEHEDGESETPSLKSTRFVFDLSLDAMGNVQLDGLFRPATGQLGRLDLVVRTQEHFSQSTQAEMRRIYAKALRDTQVTGELSFQNQPESWVTIKTIEDNRFSAQT
ncbi:MAG: hypothetical protein AAF204_04280, partial [Pseudomonadota bacterium]